MKRVTVATLVSLEDHMVARLGNLGALHIKPVRKPESPGIDIIRSQIDLLERALQVLSSRTGQEEEKVATSALETAQSVLSLVERGDSLQEQLRSMERDIARVRPVGDFSPDDFTYLKQNGINAKVYTCSKKELEQQDVSVTFEIVAANRSVQYLVAVSKEDFDLPFEELHLPEKGLSTLLKEVEECKQGIAGVEQQLDSHGAYVAYLRKAVLSLKEQQEFAEVLAGMGKDEQISYVQGYCPADEFDIVKEASQESGWGLLVEDSSEDEDIPTLIKTPPWLRMIEPVFKFMGLVPGYREFDVSFWFLASLTIFFAMLIGDGGYGLLFLLGTIGVRRIVRSAPTGLFNLLIVCSVATILWGIITGTWFGVEALAGLPVLKSLIIPNLNSFAENQDFLIQLCFIIGTVHLTIGHLVRIIRFSNSLRALAEIGWIFILWFLYFLAGNLVLGNIFPHIAVYLLVAGILFASAFSNPKGNFFKAFIVVLADLPLNIIRSFSDVVSYLRLFAIGYATLVVAVSFNAMASDLGWGNLFRVFGSILILLSGHTLNIILGAMAVLVHGIRLNMLEFSSHLGLTWSGISFKPFKIKQIGQEAQHAAYHVPLTSGE